MRASRSIWLGMLTVVSVACGQQARPGQAAVKPYTLVQTETRVQTLSDGSTITHVTVTRTIRDSHGRMRDERDSGTGFSIAGRQGDVSFLSPGEKVVSISVNDPGRHLVMSWSTGPNQTKLVRQTHAYQQPRIDRMPQAVAKDGQPRAEQRREDLGTKMVQGIELHGTRITTRYPVDFDGNTAPYTMVSESWLWREDSRVAEYASDMLDSKTTRTITSFTQEEPDSKLFEPPAGYTVWDPNNPSDEQGFQ